MNFLRPRLVLHSPLLSPRSLPSHPIPSHHPLYPFIPSLPQYNNHPNNPLHIQLTSHPLLHSWVFLFYLSCVIIFNSAATTQKQNTGITMLSLTLFFESVCFPTIVALGIRGLGKHTKRGSGWLVAGVSGGAAVPPILGASVSACFLLCAVLHDICFVRYLMGSLRWLMKVLVNRLMRQARPPRW